MPGVLALTTVDQGRRLEVRRDGEVPDDFWRKLRAEWGQEGLEPNVAVLVPVETFARRQAWLPQACRRHDIRVQLDEWTRSLLRRCRSDRDSLVAIRAGQAGWSEPDDPPQGVSRLAGTRFVRELRDFQQRDLTRLLLLDHGANFSVPGAGKTSVELAVYEAERAAERVGQILVVAPISAFDAWMQDSAACLHPMPVVHRYAGGSVPMGTELLLVNYQRLVASYETIARWVQRRPTLVVLDEAHRMKRGRSGEWGTACLDLAFLAVRRDVLTGTPAPQHPGDLVALLDFLWPGQALRVLPSAALSPQPSPKAVGEVTAAIAPLFVRTTKHELQLREPTLRVVTVPLGGLHRRIYDALRSRFSAVILTQRDRIELGAWSDVIMYLLEAATNPALLPAGSSVDDPITFRHPPLPIPDDSSLRQLIAEYASYETPAKFIQLAALVDDLRKQDRKVLVWSNFVRNLDTLQRMFAVHQPALVHGGVPSEITQPSVPVTRESELARFRTDPACGVLLANPAAFGEGVSLHQVCHDAIYLERTFNAGQYLQSVDRIHRLGLANDVETTITMLVTEGTIDTVVADRIELKARNLGIMLDDPNIATMSLPDEEDVGRPLDVGDNADIAVLLAHLRGQDDGG